MEMEGEDGFDRSGNGGRDGGEKMVVVLWCLRIFLFQFLFPLCVK